MNNYEFVKVINGILEKMDIREFYYDIIDGYILLYLPYKDFEHNGFGWIASWENVESFFKHRDIYCYILKRTGNRLNDYLFDYVLIDDAGMDFLTCLSNCSSFEELILKLQILGYDI